MIFINWVFAIISFSILWVLAVSSFSWAWCWLVAEWDTFGEFSRICERYFLITAVLASTYTLHTQTRKKTTWPEWSTNYSKHSPHRNCWIWEVEKKKWFSVCTKKCYGESINSIIRTFKKVWGEIEILVRIIKCIEKWIKKTMISSCLIMSMPRILVMRVL